METVDAHALEAVAARAWPALVAEPLGGWTLRFSGGGGRRVNSVLPGPVWNDWEDTVVAPRAWDLACLVLTPRVHGTGLEAANAALDGYGERPPEALVTARGVQLIGWSALAGNPERLERRLAWLRALSSPRTDVP